MLRPAYLSPLRKQLVSLLWLMCSLVLMICLVSFPGAIYLAAQKGVKTWWEIVFPALLPFFIGTELLVSFGVVRFMGVLLEPIMRPLFNLPGAASFVLAVGFSSGFPIGSAVTAQLRQEKLVSRAEGERLMSFTNNASPLFMLAAVAVGMFHDPRLGLVIALAHYGANLTLGLVLGLAARTRRTDRSFATACRGGFDLRRALRELNLTRQENWQPLGQRLSTAINKSVNTLLMIGGFIILFAVIIEVLGQLGVTGALGQIFARVLEGFGVDSGLGKAMATGLFEVTLGARLAAETAAPLQDKILVTTILLSWAGLSVHAQAAGMISGTDLRIFTFFWCRLFQALLSGAYVMMIFPLLITPTLPGSVPGSTLTLPALSPLLQPESPGFSWWQTLGFSINLFVSGTLVLLAIGLLIPPLVRLVAVLSRALRRI